MSCSTDQSEADIIPSPNVWSNLSEGSNRDRSLHDTRWDTVLSLRGELSDTLLLIPHWIALSNDDFYVFDAADQRLLAYDLGANVIWTFGQKGSGPGELLRVRDLKLDHLDRLYLLDPENRKIVVVSRLGELLAEIATTAVPHAEQLVPLAGDLVALLSLYADVSSPFSIIDFSGEIQSRPNLLWDRYRSLHPLLRGMRLGVADDGVTWIAAFSDGNGWFSFKAHEPGIVGRYIEHLEFPSVRRQHLGASTVYRRAGASSDNARTVHIEEECALMLFGGKSDYRGQVVDLYEITSGDYLGSYLLPSLAHEVAIRGSRFLLLDRDAPSLTLVEAEQPIAC